jgi:photosystem II stability/assembly factor-like uncharacterized protein
MRFTLVKPALRTAMLCAGLVALALLTAAPMTATVEIDSNTFGSLEARNIGSATMSGRVAAIDAYPADPLTIYIGSASGGVWKSKDGGVIFRPVFDDYTQSIGAIRIDPSNPETVWVGTGETWTRNSVSVGDGVYKTTDGGDTWKRMGLEESERIARIRVHPTDGDTVWVCATGQLWSANEQRGVYKTTDGGDTWKQVLAVDENTGCGDLAIDPQDPSILYAGMWQFRRYPDFFESGGPGSGLYKSTDGGDTWTELTKGLPEGDLGRIGIAVAPSRPNVVYAVVEAKDNALYRSNNLGESWEEINSTFNVAARPFYFANVIVDPKDYNTVYKPGLTLSVSYDGGKSFTSPFSGFSFGNIHPDNHALWINPNNPNEVIVGNDGGAYISYDGARSWRFVGTLPISQFYRVSFDMDFPYNVYGGLQDNGSWMAPSRGKSGTISNRDWDNLNGGDGFFVFRDPADADYVYSEFQGGNLSRTRLSTGEQQDIRPYPKEGEEEYRFNWNTPIHMSPNETGTLYYGAQYLLRSRDHGQSWETISPDLTTDDPQRQRQKESGGLTTDNSTAENNATVYSISESPIDGKVIWVGTDDGYVQVTRDSGGSWTNVTANIPALPAGLWVSSVEASPHDAATAFVTVDGHRSGDMATYVYETNDYGASWRSLATDDIDGYAWVIRQDLVAKDLLFLGTEFGLYMTVDHGQTWARFTGNLPKVAVHDMAVHPREHDLVIATHGRGIYILDDITPLRALTTAVLDSEVALLAGRPTVMATPSAGFGFNGDADYVAPNPPEAAPITYYQKKRHLFGDLKVEVYSADGELITTIPGSKRKGMNTVSWPMRLDPPKVPPASQLAAAFVGPRVAEGTYTVKLIKGKTTVEGEVQLVADPRSPHSAEDRALQQKTSMRLYEDLEGLTYVVETATEARDAARERAEGLKERDRTRSALEGLADSLETLRAGLVSTDEAGWLSGDEKLREQLATLYAAVTGFEGRPTQTQLDRMQELEGELAQARTRFDALHDGELAKVNAELTKKQLDPIPWQSQAEWKAGDDES